MDEIPLAHGGVFLGWLGRLFSFLFISVACRGLVFPCDIAKVETSFTPIPPDLQWRLRSVMMRRVGHLALSIFLFDWAISVTGPFLWFF